MLKIGIIGTGVIAREHAKAVAMLPGSVSLVAAADVVPQKLEGFCDSFNILRRYQRAADLIADPGVDLVAITTPPDSHEELAIAALEAGKYVFCEKPLAHSLASALRIVEAEGRHPGRLAVSYQLRYDPSFRRLLWLCRHNWIGEIRSALIERHSYIPHADHGKRGWWGTWNIAGGGVLMTQLIHQLDLLVIIMGPPLSVSAAMDTRNTSIESEDYADVTIRFANGANARCIASVNSGRLGGEFSVTGSVGAVSLPWNFSIQDPTRLVKAMSAVNRALPDTRPSSSSLVSRGSRYLARRLGLKARPELTPHARFYEEISGNIGRGEPLPIPASEGLGSLELCLASYESALLGTEVTLPLTSKSTVYHGVTKEDYDARQCSRKPVERTVTRTANINVNRRSIRIGFIGVDTSHATAFASILHNPNNPLHIPGARVVAAYPGGSTDMPISASRVSGFTAELKNIYGVQIMDAPEGVAEACDLIFILASDGRLHPALLRSIAGQGKPIFIDKPFAISAADAEEMSGLISNAGVRVFASSAFRYADGLVNALNLIHAAGERAKSCRIRYWLQIQETQGRYFWYGIHGAEMLNAIMGPGVREVSVSANERIETMTVNHDDGRQSSIIGAKDDGTFHISIETDKRQLEVDLGASTGSLASRVLWAALDVLTDGRFPGLWSGTAVGSVSGPRASRLFDPLLSDTLEIVKLLDAAQVSYSSRQPVAV